MNDVFWARRAAECAEAMRENARLREALGASGAARLLDLIGRLAAELSHRQFGEYGCESCDGAIDRHADNCPLQAALNEAAQLALNDDDSLG